MLTTLPRGVFLTHESYANKGPMLAQATADTAATIRAAGPAAQLTLSSHYRVVEREVPNVVARLHSRRPNAPDDSQRAQATGDARPPIVLSAHFDGTGDMSSRVRYPSAVDNASGTAVVLELARLLAASQGAPSTDVWIVFFNGEEQGLYGSREFVQRHRTQMRDAIVLNLDMVGHGTDAPYTVSFTEDSGAVARELANALNDAGLATTPARGGGSDHASFEGTARAVSVVQAPYRFMHQQGDVADVAAPESLAAIVSVLLKFVSGR
jgi:Zn-dependent M28 family amino/carboxypeptidase